MENAMLPELANDPAYKALIDTFNARIIFEHNATHYRGSLGMKVQVGADEYFDLPSIFLHTPVPKWELEEVRAQQFAGELIRMSREQMTAVGGRAAMHESAQFMDWVRAAYREQMNRIKEAV